MLPVNHSKVPVSNLSNNYVSITTSSSSSSRYQKWKILLFGQCIALSLACCSASSSTLQKMTGIKNMPLFQIAGGYFFLGVLNIFQLKGETETGDEIFKEHYDYCVAAKAEAAETTQLLHIKTSTKNDDDIESATNIHRNNDNLKKKDHKVQKLPMLTLPCFPNIKLHSPWYFYTILAFLDVQANYFVILSFRYTTLINTNLLTSISVVSVMTSSKLILKKIFHLPHFIGVFLVLLGSSFIVSTDLNGSDTMKTTITTATSTANSVNHNQKQHFVGDTFAIIAALLFGFNDTLAEYCIHQSTVAEYLAMMGIFGFIFSLCESIIFELQEVKEFFHLLIMKLLMTTSRTTERDYDIEEVTVTEEEDVHMTTILFLWVIYTFCLAIFYTSASYYLQLADATLLSLSLQSSNIWMMVFSILIEHVYPMPLFYLALVLVFIGVWIYEKGMDYYSFIKIGNKNTFM